MSFYRSNPVVRVKPKHLIDDFKDTIGDYLKHYSPERAKYSPRNAICITIFADVQKLQNEAITRDLAVSTLQSLFKSPIPVLPNTEINTDQTDQILSILGQDHAAVILDCTEHWPTSALGAVAGCIKAPGTLFILMPNGLELSSDASPYERHLKRALRKHLSPEPRLPGLWSILSLDSHDDLSQSTEEAENRRRQGIEQQDQVVNQLLKRCLSGERTTDLLLARRGRGKSAALGQLIEKLSQALPVGPTDASSSITLSSPHRSQVITVLKHAGLATLSHTPLQRALQLNGNILVVDEAGSVPLPVLSTLRANYTHTIYAGTVEGYEGTGRALAIRLANAKRHDANSPSSLHHHTLLQPIRWPQNDPVETMVQDILRLVIPDQPATELPTTPISIEELEHQIISSEQLLNNDTLLDEVFGLLMQAHYQTTAKDLKHLLNQQNLTLWIQTYKGTLTGACLIAHEGGLNKDLCKGIVSGERRPAHQKLPVMLYRQCHNENVLRSYHWRIVRIAIKPNYQRKRLGRYFLKALHEQAKQGALNHDEPCDFIGASFGATESGYRFWRTAGFQAIHWGYKLNPRSGQRALAVVLPVQSTTDNTVQRARMNFLDSTQTLQTLRQLKPHWLPVFYSEQLFDETLFSSLLQLSESNTDLDSSNNSHNNFTNNIINNAADDKLRLLLWKKQQLGLHEVWGPLARSLGGVDELAKLEFPYVTTAKQLTKELEALAKY